MDDLVSRQAALDRIDAIAPRKTDSDYQKGIDVGMAMAKVAIIEQESAEPEIIRCNACKHWAQTTGKMKGYGLGRCDFHDAHLVTCNGFCYWAERREE